MNSVWLCCDNVYSACSSKKDYSRSIPYFGVFTDDPARIALRISRPKTPFVPAPIHLSTFENDLVDFGTETDGFSDRSPSGDMDDEMNLQDSSSCPDAADSFF
jgi:hypothetical protein